MPLIAIVNEQYLCMHGGLSPYFTSIDVVNKVNRFAEIPYEGLICDLLWSDPIEDELCVNFDFKENDSR